MIKYDNFLLLGDFNSEIQEPSMTEFCELYNFSNLIKDPTCFNPTSIDVILTNKVRSFQNNNVIERGLSDHHKLTLNVLKLLFQKQAPITIKYRDYKYFDLNTFHIELQNSLIQVGIHNINYESFETIFMNHLNNIAPMKTKCVRANNAAFMNKTLSKAIMTRSRLKTKYNNKPNILNQSNYKKYRNYCVNLFRREKRSIMTI